MPLTNTVTLPHSAWAAGLYAHARRRWGEVSLRTKTLTIVAATVVALMALISIPLRIFVLESYLQLEERQVRTDVDRAANALAADLADLSRAGADYAASESTYALATEAHAGFIERGLTNAALLSQRVNLFLLVDDHGRTIYGRAFDLATSREIPLPEQLREQVSPALLPGQASYRSGILRLPEALLLVSAHPVTGADPGQPARGTLIVGRALDTAAVRELAATTRLRLTVHRLDATYPAPDVVAARDALAALPTGVVRPLDSQTIAGYRLLTDVEGRPVAVLRVEAGRPMYAHGQASSLYFTIGLVLAACMSGGVALLLLERSVVARQTRLSAEVLQIGASGDLSARVAVLGGDEIGQLSAAINTMLGSLERAQRERDRAVHETRLAAANLRDAYSQLQVLTDQLRRSRDTLRTLFDGLDDGMALIDGAGVVLAANQRLATLLAGSPEAIVGSAVSGLDDADGPAARPIAAAVRRTLRTGQICRERVVLDDEAGHRRVFDMQVLPLLDEAGAVEQAIVHVTDVTERLRLEAAALQSERLAAGARLAAAVAHELNTPLQSIQSCLDLVRISDQEQREAYLTIAQEEIRRISGILRSLLMVHRPGDGGPAPVDLNALVERLLLLTSGALGDRSVYVERDLAPELPPVRARQDQLTQVLLNLVMNAAEAMSGGGTITISTRHIPAAELPAEAPGPAGAVVIEVADTGPGVPPELRSRIFDPFFTTKPEGSGLGLAICRQIIADHAGAIDIGERPGAGAVFRVTLPAEECAAGAQEVQA